MSEDKYQIVAKADYVNLLLLKDELEYFDDVLSDTLEGKGSWLVKLRATRGVFLTLNNVKNAAERIRIKGSQDFTARTRRLRKELIFAKHFRNNGVGHLSPSLLKRAVQWSPQLFHESFKDKDRFKIEETYRAIIESCINSFIDVDKKQRVFGHEIDLMYPPEAQEFFTYLCSVVREAICWLSDGIVILGQGIDYHSGDRLHEMAAIAGQTSFDLKCDSDLNFCTEKAKSSFFETLNELEQKGALDADLSDFLRDRLNLITVSASNKNLRVRALISRY